MRRSRVNTALQSLIEEFDLFPEGRDLLPLLFLLTVPPGQDRADEVPVRVLDCR